jgi:hypothetical protein
LSAQAAVTGHIAATPVSSQNQLMRSFEDLVGEAESADVTGSTVCSATAVIT